VTRTVAVTGATGFIGGHVVEHLGRAGWQVRVLTRRLPQFPDVAVEAVVGALDDNRALARLVDGADAIVHVAGLVKARSRAEFFAANATGTGNLATAARQGGRSPRFVLVSSLAAREPQLSDYAASKRAGETELARCGDGLLWSILRPPAVYGPGDREILTFFRALWRGIALLPTPRDGRLSLIHAADLAAAATALAESPGPAGEVYEVDDGRPGGYRWEEMADMAARHLAVRPLRIRVPPPLLVALAHASAAGHRLTGSPAMLTPGKAREILHRDWVCRDGRLAAATGWQPRIGLDEGVAETIAWYRKNGWL